jgi:hypothetical protein
MAQSVRKPCLAAAASFVVLALLIGRLAIAPLGWADVLGIAACAAAAGVFAALAFAYRPPDSAAVGRPLVPADLADQILAAVDARLPVDAGRHSGQVPSARLVVQSEPPAAPLAPAGSRPALSTDDVTPSSANAKPRLGRGLAGLIHHPAALASSSTPPAGETTAPAPDHPAAA